MIKLAGAFFRRPDLSRSDCIRHYREQHGKVVRETANFRRHVDSYTQHDRIEVSASLAPTDEAICGVTQLSYRDVAALSAAFNEPDYSKFIRPDEHRFVDLARSLIVIGEQTSPVPGGAEAPVRLFRFLTVAQRSLERELREFRKNVYGPSIQDELSPLLAGYVQVAALSRDANPIQGSSTVDGLDEFRFRHVDDIALFVENEASLSARLCLGELLVRDKIAEIATNYRVVI
jgi:hypothetical protein